MSTDHTDESHSGPHSPPRPDQDDTITYYRAMEIAVRELLRGEGKIHEERMSRGSFELADESPKEISPWLRLLG